MVPTVSLVPCYPGRNPDVEAWVDVAYTAVDVLVNLLLGNGLLGSPALAWSNRLVFVVQPELH